MGGTNDLFILLGSKSEVRNEPGFQVCLLTSRNIFSLFLLGLEAEVSINLFFTTVPWLKEPSNQF
jgi:hypothetical protein